MKKFFLFLLTLLLLFSCATGQKLERVETNVERIEDEVPLEENGSGELPLLPLQQEEKNEEDISSLPVLFNNGEFIDIKNGETYTEEEKVVGLPSETLVIEEEESAAPESPGEKGVDIERIVIYVLSALVLLLLVILFSMIHGRKKDKEESIEEPVIWDEREEYSSLLYILNEEKCEEKKNF